MPKKAALLLDGGFVRKVLCRPTQPKAGDIEAYCLSVMARPELAAHELFRVYYYDAPPFEGRVTNPISGVVTDFSVTPQARAGKALIDSLETKPLFAVRRGELLCHGWKLGRTALKNMQSTGRTQIQANDVMPSLEQKGVDMRIGLDIAWMALKRIVDCLVLVTGDSDFIPAMKLARREGLHVYLDTLKTSMVSAELRAHADIVL